MEASFYIYDRPLIVMSVIVSIRPLQLKIKFCYLLFLKWQLLRQRETNTSFVFIIVQ